MHAYGHEWACQLVYNPRIIEGLGLTDGEGTERLWSRFIKLIGIERSSSVSLHENLPYLPLILPSGNDDCGSLIGKPTSSQAKCYKI